jgi:hypothetical protein
LVGNTVISLWTLRCEGGRLGQLGRFFFLGRFLLCAVSMLGVLPAVVVPAWFPADVAVMPFFNVTSGSSVCSIMPGGM